MTKQRYAVPEAGVKAAESAHYDLYEAHPSTPSVGYIAAHLEAFIRWQDGKLEKMNRRMDTGTEAEKESYRVGWEHGIADVRRMYLAAPEPVFLFNGISVKKDPTLEPGTWRWEKSSTGSEPSVSKDTNVLRAEFAGIPFSYTEVEPEESAPDEPSDKERADCNMACLLYMVERVEKGDAHGLEQYAAYVRSMLKLAERTGKAWPEVEESARPRS